MHRLHVAHTVPHARLAQRSIKHAGARALRTPAVRRAMVAWLRTVPGSHRQPIRYAQQGTCRTDARQSPATQRFERTRRSTLTKAQHILTAADGDRDARASQRITEGDQGSDPLRSSEILRDPPRSRSSTAAREPHRDRMHRSRPSPRHAPTSRSLGAITSAGRFSSPPLHSRPP